MIRPVGKKVVLRYTKEYIDNANIISGLYIDTRWREGEFALEVAFLEHDSEKYNLKKGCEVLVSYIVQWDNKFTDSNNNGSKISGIRKRNVNFIQLDENGDELRWADESQIYGYVKDGNIYPVGDWIFCEVPKNEHDEIKKNGIILLSKKQDTDKKAYITNVISVSCNKKDDYNVSEGNKIACLPNSDIPFKYANNDYIRVPMDRILGVYLT